jgi:hypothetical protein
MMPGEDWVPYSKLLTKLTGKVRGDQEKYEEDQKRAVAIFIRDTLGKLAGTQVVVVAYAQNARSRWGFLGDGRTVADKIQFGDGPVQRIALYRGLRLIRVRDGLREETPSGGHRTTKARPAWPWDSGHRPATRIRLRPTAVCSTERRRRASPTKTRAGPTPS